MKLKDRLIKAIQEAVEQAQKDGVLPTVVIPDITVEKPQNASHGDFASSLPLKLARSAKMDPLSIAENITRRLPVIEEVTRTETARPGFINFHVNNGWFTSQVDGIIAEGNNFGSNNSGNNLKVQLEFVSVNPTGPLHVGHGRGAVLGSTLARVLRECGFHVSTEYYINDAGNQIENFGRTLLARYYQVLGRKTPIPEEGYHGQYMLDLAREVVNIEGDKFIHLPEEEALKRLKVIGLKRMLSWIRTDLNKLQVVFDDWFSESSLIEGGLFEKVFSILKGKGFTSEKEGATWFVSTALGENKDNVLIRGNSSPTYFATDIAYHYNKFLERKLDRVIDIWGADHQGHVSRMKAVMTALDLDPQRLTIIISQMVTLIRSGEVVRLSKRSGDIITLAEVVEEVGADACRYFFLSRSAESQMDFDLELAKKQSDENPVYYIQYAHARICSILRLAKEKGINFDNGDTSLLNSESEIALIKKILEMPELLELVAIRLQPHHLPFYSLELATLFHAFYRDCRVVSDNTGLTKARLKLVEAMRIVLLKVLNVMGMSAPESM